MNWHEDRTPVRLVHCSSPECPATVKNHAWGKIKATGWLFQHNGDSWCPEHIPEWYPAWKEKQDKMKHALKEINDRVERLRKLYGADSADIKCLGSTVAGDWVVTWWIDDVTEHATITGNRAHVIETLDLMIRAVEIYRTAS